MGQIDRVTSYPATSRYPYGPPHRANSSAEPDIMQKKEMGVIRYLADFLTI